ncbi:hypothetical protein DFJ73DRAFT_792424 [Zopfochytrium polystomum]|nr:hypothetical protein DFJ73DRAFT_792424 [Zopfochytrium polystomum]
MVRPTTTTTTTTTPAPSAPSTATKQPSAAIAPPPSLLRRTASQIAKRVYQFELTFGLYMLNPVEKYIFHALIATFALLMVYAAVSFMPETAKYVVSRGRYYLSSESL